MFPQMTKNIYNDVHGKMSVFFSKVWKRGNEYTRKIFRHGISKEILINMIRKRSFDIF